VSIIFYT